MAVDEITWLEQQPDGEHGGEEAVDEQDQRPGDDRASPWRAADGRHLDGHDVGAHVDSQVEQSQGDQGRDEDSAATFVDPDSNGDSDRK